MLDPKTFWDWILTIGKELGRLVCKLRGDIDGDITVTTMGIILCNITATGKIQEKGSVSSLLSEVEEAIDKVDDLADGLDKVKDATGDLQDAAD